MKPCNNKRNHTEAGNEHLNPNPAPGLEVLLCGPGEGSQNLACDPIEPPQDLQQMLSAVTATLAQVCGTFGSAAVFPPLRLCYEMTVTSGAVRSVPQTAYKAFVPLTDLSFPS